jgi:hypothetical protein
MLEILITVHLFCAAQFAMLGARRPDFRRQPPMDDLVFLLLTLAFFAACVGLVGLFERMRPRP